MQEYKINLTGLNFNKVVLQNKEVKIINIIIREWQIEDALELVEIINNKKILDNLRDGIPYPYTLSDAEEFINSNFDADRNTQYTWAITLDNKLIGSIGVFRKDNIHNRTGEIGYYISEEYWGKGVGTKVLKDVCNYIFSNTNIIRIFAEPFADNIASCKILEKSGFVLEGILRKNAVKNGKIIDMKMYALIKD